MPTDQLQQIAAIGLFTISCMILTAIVMFGVMIYREEKREAKRQRERIDSFPRARRTASVNHKNPAFQINDAE